MASKSFNLSLSSLERVLIKFKISLSAQQYKVIGLAVTGLADDLDFDERLQRNYLK